MTIIELLDHQFLGVHVIVTQDDYSKPKVYTGIVKAIYSESNNYHADSLYFEFEDERIVSIEPDTNIEIV